MNQLHTFDEIFDSQKMFRKVLEAMANPTRKLSVSEFIPKLFGDEPVMLAMAMTLLDNEVSFSVCEDRELAENIALLTHSKEVSPCEADFIFVTDTSNISNVIGQAKCGTLSDPHSSATIIVKCDEKADSASDFYGAGIDGTVTACLPCQAIEAISARDGQCYEYPQGIDLIFVSDSGEFFCIPRLTLRRDS